MRSHGAVERLDGLGVSDHVCWTYGSARQEREYRAAAVRFAADGLALGQRVLHVSDRPQREVLAELAPLGDAGELGRRGRVALAHIDAVYRGGGPVRDVDAQLAVYDGALARSLADGFAGLRVVAEVTALVAHPVGRAVHAAWELVADRYIAAPRPLAALCAYDRRVIGDEDAAAVACVHPLRHDRRASFSVFARDGGLAIDGEVDAYQASLLDRTLAAVPPYDSLVVDVSDLSFIDLAGVAVLARHLAGRAEAGAAVEVRHARPVLRRLWEMLRATGAESVSFR